jgi:CelD/BcsL family acetyltransferase involved in cellulose biosynthesis
MLTIEVVNSFDSFMGLESVWNDLLEKSDIDVPFMTFEYLCFWWKIYGLSNQMLVVILKDNGEYVAIAPLMRQKMSWRGLPVTAITFMANYHSTRTGLIVTKESENLFTVILDYVKSNYQFDMFCFDLFVKNTATDRLLISALKGNALKYRMMTGELSPYIVVNDDYENYLKGRSKKFLKNLKYRNNLIAREGGYDIIAFSDNNVDEAMDMSLKISAKTAQFRQKTAIVNSSDSTYYHTRLAHMASQLGWLKISVLKHKLTPIAFEFKLIYKKTVYLLKVGFDVAYSRYATGTIMLSHSIKESFDTHGTEFNFLGKNEPHKLEWTSLTREHQKYWIFNDTAYARFLYFWESVIIAPLKYIRTMINSRIRHNPAPDGV